MIDPNEPIEFEDGMPLEVVLDKPVYYRDSINVLIPAGTPYTYSGAKSHQDRVYWYYLKTGILGGYSERDTNYKRIRNVKAGPPLVDKWE